jgi:hypothetical protein
LRIALLYEGNTAYFTGFSNVTNITFVENSSIKVKGRISVSLGRKPSISEAGGYSTLLPYEN